MPRPQFNLRALLAAMLVVAAFCAGMVCERQRRQRAEQTELEAMKLTIEYQLMPHPVKPGEQNRKWSDTSPIERVFPRVRLSSEKR